MLEREAYVPKSWLWTPLIDDWPWKRLNLGIRCWSMLPFDCALLGITPVTSKCNDHFFTVMSHESRCFASNCKTENKSNGAIVGSFRVVFIIVLHRIEGCRVELGGTRSGLIAIWVWTLIELRRNNTRMLTIAFPKEGTDRYYRRLVRNLCLPCFLWTVRKLVLRLVLERRLTTCLRDMRWKKCIWQTAQRVSKACATMLRFDQW